MDCHNGWGVYSHESRWVLDYWNKYLPGVIHKFLCHLFSYLIHVTTIGHKSFYVVYSKVSFLGRTNDVPSAFRPFVPPEVVPQEVGDRE